MDDKFFQSADSFNKKPVQRPALKMTREVVSKVISKMKAGKAAGTSGIVIEILNVVGGHSLIKLCMRD